ncbi:hypothetical protein Y032_0044g907 [Ancylostoma ceylanicum]|uniref:Uncharacterized protein n=1 Tax=Ancylostoma ceylanicum TaxID=53326 RepID=A0A016UDR0_9BILA|nr:hypothetical protein Y032_0044g907 [Ancylostoma ceylanicum]
MMNGIVSRTHRRLEDPRAVRHCPIAGIAPIAGKLRDTCLKWYSHALRATRNTVCKVGLDLEVSRKRPKGWPKQRWLDALHAYLKHVGVHSDQAHDRAKWRQKIKKANTATEGAKR